MGRHKVSSIVHSMLGGRNKDPLFKKKKRISFSGFHFMYLFSRPFRLFRFLSPPSSILRNFTTMSNPNEIFEIFNDKNEKIGEEKRGIVHQTGLYHRAVNIFLFNKDKKLLIQKR